MFAQLMLQNRNNMIVRGQAGLYLLDFLFSSIMKQLPKKCLDSTPVRALDNVGLNVFN